MLVPEIFWHYDGCNLDFPKLFMNKNLSQKAQIGSNDDRKNNPISSTKKIINLGIIYLKNIPK
jgi:hypothetical protein